MTKSLFHGKSFRRDGYPDAISSAGQPAPLPELDSCSALDCGPRRLRTTRTMKARKHAVFHSPYRIRPPALLGLYTSTSRALSMAQQRRQTAQARTRKAATRPPLRILKGLSARSTSHSAEREWIPKPARPLRISSTQTRDS